MNSPLITVVIPCYNSSRYIDEALQSVSAQSFKDFECLVIDDCSTDDTVSIIEKHIVTDSRFKLVKSSKNSGGASVPRNIAIDLARGKYIAFLDSDDSWLERKLELQYEFMEKNRAEFSCTGYHVLLENGEVLFHYPPRENSYNGLLATNTVGCSTVMIRKSYLGSYRFPMCGHEDFALWLDLLRSGSLVYGLPDLLTNYRVIDGSLSSNKIKVIGYIWNIYRKREKKTLLKSVALFLRYAVNARKKYKNV